MTVAFFFFWIHMSYATYVYVTHWSLTTAPPINDRSLWNVKISIFVLRLLEVRRASLIWVREKKRGLALQRPFLASVLLRIGCAALGKALPVSRCYLEGIHEIIAKALSGSRSLWHKSAFAFLIIHKWHYWEWGSGRDEDMVEGFQH